MTRKWRINCIVFDKMVNCGDIRSNSEVKWSNWHLFLKKYFCWGEGRGNHNTTGHTIFAGLYLNIFNEYVLFVLTYLFLHWKPTFMHICIYFERFLSCIHVIYNTSDLCKIMPYIMSYIYLRSIAKRDFTTYINNSRLSIPNEIHCHRGLGDWETRHFPFW